jgi:cellobiose dehydrogenase (acceptor)
MFAMVTSRVISFLLFVVSLNGVQAQSSTPYTDAATGISFQRFTSSISSYSFSLALPEDSSSDFIGQISATTAGWAGVSLRTSMRNSLLVAAWSNGESIVSSLRTTAAYSSPGIYTGAAKIKPIEKGISVNSTGFKYTFLCENCIIDGMAFNASLDRGTLGWARSTDAVTTPSSPSSGLTFHNGGFGGFGVDLAGARSAEFASWAALAREGNTTIPSPPDTNNGTTPRPDNNTTVPISNSTYDYIVVGGGASGLVVSERLAETGKSVLVLERGGPSYYSSGGDLLVPWNETLTIYDIPGFFNALAGWPGNNAYCIDVPGRAGCILGGGK